MDTRTDEQLKIPTDMQLEPTSKEQALIQESLKPVTVASLCEDLRALGIVPGDLVLVHSSLSSLGWVCGGSQAAVMGLLAALSSSNAKGTLVMPAHSGEWSDPAEWRHPPVPEEWIPIIRDNMPAYDPDMTPTRGMGKIPETFRKFPGTHRSANPQLSFTANGPLAHRILEGHPLSPMLGMSSPLGFLYANDAKVLLLGVDYDKCTALHLAESMWDGMPKVRMGTAMMEEGERIWKWFEDYDYDSDDFISIGLAFEQVFPVIRGKVGRADCRLFDMKAAVDFALSWISMNRTPECSRILTSEKRLPEER